MIGKLSDSSPPPRRPDGAEQRKTMAIKPQQLAIAALTSFALLSPTSVQAAVPVPKVAADNSRIKYLEALKKYNDAVRVWRASNQSSNEAYNKAMEAYRLALAARMLEVARLEKIYNDAMQASLDKYLAAMDAAKTEAEEDAASEATDLEDAAAQKAFDDALAALPPIVKPERAPKAPRPTSPVKPKK